LFSIDWLLTIEVRQSGAPVRRAALPVAVLPGWEGSAETAHAVVAGE
jgi:hypothetical protein